MFNIQGLCERILLLPFSLFMPIQSYLFNIAIQINFHCSHFLYKYTFIFNDKMRLNQFELYYYICLCCFNSVFDNNNSIFKKIQQLCKVF